MYQALSCSSNRKLGEGLGNKATIGLVTCISKEDNEISKLSNEVKLQLDEVRHVHRHVTYLCPWTTTLP